MNDKPEIEVGKLPVITKFIYTLGVLPTSYLMSMTYQEQVTWLCNYLQTQVIPLLNTESAAIQELQTLYELLRTYVNDYFDNLDVQEEINSKLDEMTEDGSLTELIKNYVNPIYESYENEINNEVSNMQNQITNGLSNISNGTPLVASSTSGMTDTSRIYVNTSDGHWYWYNGTTWTDGGVYQATGIGENTITIQSLDSNIKSLLNITSPTYTITSGYMMNRNAVAVAQENTMYTSPIELKQNESILFIARGQGTNVSMISECDSEGNNRHSKVVSIDSTLRNYRYTATSDTYVILSCYTTLSYTAFKYKEIDEIESEINNIKNKLGYRKPIYTEYENFYIKFDETIVSTAGTFYTSPIELLKGEKITFNAKGYQDNVAMISKSDSEGNNRKLLVRSTDNNYKAYSYTATENMYVVLSCQVGSVKPYAEIEFDLLSLANENLEVEATKNLYKSFLKVGCIGDSLASGEAAYHTGSDVHYSDVYKHSWGQYMARMSGNTYYNFSKGGLTSKTWLSDSMGYPQASQPDKKCDAYIIGLGENDRNHLTLGTINDIDLTDYHNNNDTFYGNYAGIIQRMKEIQPKAKFFLVTMPSLGETQTNFNNAIRAICNTFSNCYLIDLTTDKYLKYYRSGSIIDSFKRSGHYNAIAYNIMATMLSNAINDVMLNNLSEFNQIEFIGTNYQW